MKHPDVNRALDLLVYQQYSESSKQCIPNSIKILLKYSKVTSECRSEKTFISKQTIRPTDIPFILKKSYNKLCFVNCPNIFFHIRKSLVKPEIKEPLTCNGKPHFPVTLIDQ